MANIYYKKNITSFTPEKLLGQDFINELKRKFNVKKVNARLVQYPWDLININKEQIKSDFTSHIKDGLIQEIIYEGVHIIKDSQIFTGKNTVIKPGCVLDAEKSPKYT